MRPTPRTISPIVPEGGNAVHPAAISPEVLLRQCVESRTRRSGPGGQHRNKVETAVVLRHEPTGVTAEASERRSQAENRIVALARLRLRLALEHRTPRGPGGPSELWRSRLANRRIVVAATHADFPTLVAEAFDQLVAASFNTATAAETLGVTATQLANLFRKAPSAWTAFNRGRVAHGLRPLASS